MDYWFKEDLFIDILGKIDDKYILRPIEEDLTTQSKKETTDLVKVKDPFEQRNKV